MKKFIVPAAIIVVAAIVSYGFLANRSVADTADIIYVNGKILTMDSLNSTAQAVAVKDGKILKVGTSADLMKLKSGSTQITDLKGKTMIPGIIDGHSHFMGISRARTVDLSPPPFGEVKSIPDVIAALKKYTEQNKLKPGEWIAASGYDDEQLVEKRHITVKDLDKDFPDNPIIITHASGHISVVNSKAFQVSGVTKSTPDPVGGQIVKDEKTKELTGLLLEKGRSVLKIDRKEMSLEERLKLLDEQQTKYASYGITTAQDGGTSLESIELLKYAADNKRLFIDIEALAAYAILDSVLGKPEYPFNTINNHFKLAGLKLVSDGAAQNKTAFLSKPYLTAVPGCDHNCAGIPTVPANVVDEAVMKGFKNNVHVFVHANGDAAIDVYINAVKKASRELKVSSNSLRPVVIHSQYMRPGGDQLDSFKELGMYPAFFTNHTFFWGDVHIPNLGVDRANYISPLQSALKKKIIFSNHTDFGVTPIDQMFLTWTAVNRLSRSGKVMGAGERVSPLEALRAITISAAYEYFEENIKGSIEAGKMADLAVLSEDPLSIDKMKIRDIVVLETIKEGKSIFKRN